jgi:putative cell wall-binding protein
MAFPFFPPDDDPGPNFHELLRRIVGPADPTGGSLQLGHAPADTPSMLRRSLPLLLAALGVLGVVRPVPVVAAPGPQEYPVHAVGLVPDDPYYPDQWGPKKIGMEDAWAETTGASSTVIAVIDTGVDPTYPDLAGKVLPGWDFVDNDADAFDEHGHGSYVALVVAAMGNDATGMAGHCWQCKILPVRVLDENGNGDTGGVASGIVWAADHGADVINLSLAGSSSSSTLENAVSYARARGIMLVAAAGNQTSAGQDPTQPQYPAALPGIVSVAASDPDDNLYSWSYRGASWVQVTAPGCIVGDNGLDDPCGTSFASPVVAGVLGLAFALAPCEPGADLASALYANTTAVSGGAVAHGRVVVDDFLADVITSARTRRLAGLSRITTAIAISKRIHPTSTSVVLARFDNYADALAAAPLAAKLGAPVLLTTSNALDGNVEGEIKRLGATTAVLAGGTAALAPAVATRLQQIGVTPDRIAGQNRYETAALIGQRVGGSTVYLVSAAGFADAVAVSGLAASRQAPILLVDKDSVPGPTSSALNVIHPASKVVVGGTAVISDAVQSALGATRLAGSNRYETSQKVGEATIASVPTADPARVWVATGANWPDALAAGPAAAASDAVLLLTDPSAGMVRSWLSYYNGTDLSITGGPVSISDPTACSMDAAM